MKKRAKNPEENTQTYVLLLKMCTKGQIRRPPKFATFGSWKTSPITLKLISHQFAFF